MAVNYQDLIGLLGQTPYMHRNPTGDMFTLPTGVTGLDLGGIDPKYVSQAGNFQMSPEQFIQAYGSGALGMQQGNSRQNTVIQNQGLLDQILGGQNVAMGGGMSPEQMSQMMLGGGPLQFLSGGMMGGGDPLGSYGQQSLRRLGVDTPGGNVADPIYGGTMDNPFYQNDAYARALQGAGYNINAPQRPAPAPTQPLPGQGGGWSPRGDRREGGGPTQGTMPGQGGWGGDRGRGGENTWGIEPPAGGFGGDYQTQPTAPIQQGGGGMPGNAGDILPFNQRFDQGNYLGGQQNQMNQQFGQDQQRLRGSMGQGNAWGRNPYAQGGQGGGGGQGGMPPWMYGGGMMSPWGNQMMGGWNPWQQDMPWMQPDFLQNMWGYF